MAPAATEPPPDGLDDLLQRLPSLLAEPELAEARITWPGGQLATERAAAVESWLAAEAKLPEGALLLEAGYRAPEQGTLPAFRAQERAALDALAGAQAAALRAGKSEAPVSGARPPWAGAWPGMAFRMDQDGTFLEVWPGPVNELLAPPEAHVGQSIEVLFPGEVGKRALEDLGQVAASGQPMVAEYEVEAPEGRRTFLASLTPLGGGEVLVLSREVTGEATMQASLAATRASLESLLAALPGIVTRFDQELRHVYVSPQVEEVVGVPPEAFLGKTNRELGMDETLVARWEAAIGRVLETGEPAEIEFVFETEAGTRNFRSTLVPEAGPDGQVQHVIALAMDVTDAKEGEALRERAIRQEEEVKRLLQIDAFKTRFLNTAAHELATPLTPIRFQLEALGSGILGDLDPAQREALEVVTRNIERFTRLTRDLLDSARLQAGQLSMEHGTVDLSDLLAASVGSVRAQADDAGLDLEHQVEGELRVRGDRGRLEQVMANLLSNALKFTPEGGRVTVRAQRQGERVRVEVADTGSGIAPAATGRLFQPFVQLAEDARARGTGLGLYICKGIVEAHGGEIGVESPGIGEGTTVWFELPASST